MTRWAFVSDIHGNRRRLERAAELAVAGGADHYVSLGDVVGKGDPNGCVGWVRDHATIALVGNRDLDYLGLVSPELQEVVLSWPREANASNFVVTHGDSSLHRLLHSGAIRDGFRRARSYLAQQGADLWFFGHTHWARVWRLDDPEPVFLGGNGFQLQEGVRYAVNVGTTGLPRARRGGVSMTFYDDAARTLEIVPLERSGLGARRPRARSGDGRQNKPSEPLVYSRSIPVEV